MNPPGLAYSRLNLTRNPFGELTQAERVHVACVDTRGWLAKLQEPASVLQVLGECGRGKTTHLLSLAAGRPGSLYVYLPEDRPPRVPRRRCSLLLVDEAQRLSGRQRERLFRRQVPLVLGTHEDFSNEIRLAGRRLESTFQVADLLTPSHLCRILNRRIRAARRSSGPIPRLTMGEAERLLSEFGDDVRAIEGFLYDVFQRTSESCDGQMRPLDRIR